MVKELPLVSVIVAAYNVDQYLDKCIESLAEQTMRDIEIIIVNDGSSDGTAEICDLWRKKDSRIKIITQQNQGLSAARNAGLKIASGNYVGFVDGDDYVRQSMYEDLFKQASSGSADIVSCPFIDCYDGLVKQIIQGENYIVTAKEALRHLLKNTGKFTAHMCNKLFRTELIREKGFPVGKTYEDSHVIVDLLLRSHMIGIVDKGEYFYCHREGSIVESKFSEKDFSLLDAWQKNRKMISSAFPDLKEENDYRFFWTCFYLLDKMLIAPDENTNNIKKMTGFLRKNKKSILCNRYFRRTRKFGFFILCISIRGYCVLSEMNRKGLNYGK